MLQSSVHIVVVRGFHARIGLGQRDVESMVEYDQRQRALFESVILRLANLFYNTENKKNCINKNNTTNNSYKEEEKGGYVVTFSLFSLSTITTY